MAKEKERSEVKVQEGPDGFPFLKNQKYIFKYSFKAKEGMRVAKRFTHLGQLKGSKGGYMIKGDPIYSLTANNSGLMVRFSNLESIEDFHPGMEKHMDWDKATGNWVHVTITTVFGQSMEVKGICASSVITYSCAAIVRAPSLRHCTSSSIFPRVLEDYSIKCVDFAFIFQPVCQKEH